MLLNLFFCLNFFYFSLFYSLPKSVMMFMIDFSSIDFIEGEVLLCRRLICLFKVFPSGEKDFWQIRQVTFSFSVEALQDSWCLLKLNFLLNDFLHLLHENESSAWLWSYLWFFKLFLCLNNFPQQTNSWLLFLVPHNCNSWCLI